MSMLMSKTETARESSTRAMRTPPCGRRTESRVVTTEGRGSSNFLALTTPDIS